MPPSLPPSLPQRAHPSCASPYGAEARGPAGACALPPLLPLPPQPLSGYPSPLREPVDRPPPPPPLAVPDFPHAPAPQPSVSPPPPPPPAGGGAPGAKAPRASGARPHGRQRPAARPPPGQAQCIADGGALGLASRLRSRALIKAYEHLAPRYISDFP